MTKVWTQNLNCPKCGNNQEIPIWQTVNVTLNPELLDKLLRMEINIFACTKCKEITILGTPLLYHDMDKKYCVQSYPPEELTEDEFYKQFTINGHLRFPKKIADMLTKQNALYLKQPHIVFSMKELIRYVMFREGLVMDEKKNDMSKSSGFEKTSGKYHDELKKAIAPHKKEVLRTSEINKIIKRVPTLKEKEEWIYPSDHCINHTNKGACKCAKTKNALFKKIIRGKYQVL